MIKKIIQYCIFIVLFSSCGSNEVNSSAIENFIIKYQSEDFSYFRNYKIIIRQSNYLETIYMVSDSDSGIESVDYFVYVNNVTNNISKIKPQSVKLTSKLKEDAVRSMINRYQKYKFPYLNVYKDNSVSINPFYVDMNPFFLRLEVKSEEMFIKKNFVRFKRYKDNWYLKD